MALLKLRNAIPGGLLAAVLWLSPAAPARAETTSLEMAVKANYLYKFAPFVEWPPRSFQTAQSPFNICVLGEDPFGRALDEAVRGQRLGGHPIALRRAATAEPGMGCHLVFAGKSATQTTAEMLRIVSGQPVLTVTDQSRGVTGGMIQFVLQDGRVRFEIDAAAAEASGVTISSKLLSLASSVRRNLR
jgi:hypothetical protein